MANEDVNRIVKELYEKVERFKEAGIDPYPPRADVSHFVGDLLERYSEVEDAEALANAGEFALAGRIVSLRFHGRASFAHIRDMSGTIQLYFREDVVGKEFYRKVLKKLDVGDFVGARGRLFRTRTGELTVQVERADLLSKLVRPLPEKWHGLKDKELRYRQRYLDLVANEESRNRFLVRARMVQGIRNFLSSKRFIEVETPTMQVIPGGAAAKPFVTHHNTLDLDLYLRIAPELYLKRLVVGGFDRVFELGKCYRNEGISTEHNPEFTMVEFYMAYANYNTLMELSEEMVSTLATEILGSTRVRYGDEEIDFTPPWRRVSFKDALVEVGGAPVQVWENEDSARAFAEGLEIETEHLHSHGKVLGEIFDELVEPKLVQPTFVYDYPVDISPLAKSKPGDPGVVERFELFVARREIANAYTELNDPREQRERMLQQLRERDLGDEEAQRLDEDYIRALEYALPPTAGEGIGVDRLVMLFTDAPSIRDVILFPTLRPQGG